VSDSGSEEGAEGRWQARSRAAKVASRDWLTCADVHKQTEHYPLGRTLIGVTREPAGSSGRPARCPFCRGFTKHAQ